MFEGTVVEAPGAAVLAALDDVLDRFAALDLTGCSDDDLLELMLGVEERTRRLATVDHALIGEADTRGVAGERGCRSTAALLMHLLRLSAAEASARVRAARQLAPRRAFTGEVFSPEFAQLAAAQATGTVSAAQAALITRTVSGLPEAVRDEHGESVQAFLVEQARSFGPDTLGRLARRVVDTLVKDPRTAEQRNHDGLRDALLMILRSGELPTCNGVAATLIFTMRAEDAHRGEGLATTGHGATVPASPTCNAPASTTAACSAAFTTGSSRTWGGAAR